MTPTRIPPPGWEVELAKTARRLELRSGLIAYAWGKGPRVLLVHGWDGRGTQMGKIASAVADAGFEVICLDLPGHGESPGKLTHVPGAKDALLRVGEELGPFHAVIGHSFGAGAAIFALYHGLKADRAVYLAGPSRFIELFDRYCAWVGVRGRARNRFVEKVAAFVGLDPAENYPALWATKVDQPALIIHDHDDRDAPFSDGQEMHRAWRGSRFFPTSGLGHRRILKSKEVIAEIVAFVREKNRKPPLS
jgi:pimeloyl-ACP methyl ester carboxylesterase